jgi:hypothetical protein
VLTYLTAETLPGVRSSDRRELDGVSGFNHHAVADHHRDVAVPTARSLRSGPLGAFGAIQ